MQIELRNASVRFGDKTVLSSVTLTIRIPSLTVLMGPSGSGKSTLLALLAGEVGPRSGSRSVSTGRITRLRPAWIFQSSPLLARRTSVDNVALGPRSIGQSIAESKRRAVNAMTMLGIEDLALVPAFRLSGGERQRVVVARAVATDANLILADEPTASLDAPNRAKVCDALLAASSAGSAVIVATHDPEVARITGSVIRVSPIDQDLRSNVDIGDQ